MQALLTLLFAFWISTGATADVSVDHPQQAKIRYPYSLIGDDHGILSEQDLAMSTCHSMPISPFVPHDPGGGAYWKCFESKTVSVQCESNGKADEHEGVMGLIVLSATEGDDAHDYIGRRPWPIQECRESIRDVRKRLRDTHYACIMGTSLSLENTPQQHSKYVWLFDAVRTRRGCESYFQQCDLNDLVKNGGCRPAPLLGPVRLPPDPNFWILHKSHS
ncbi:hypothetical protein WDW37_04970 [Bdellovibrionota bacterium FG-1]